MTNKIDALNTTVEIVAGATYAPGVTFRVTDIPVATPFNYIEKGYKEIDEVPEVHRSLTADYRLPENIDVQLVIPGDYYNYDKHQFVVCDDAKFLLLRLFDTNLTPMTFNECGHDEHIGKALNKDIDLLASWHETSLVPSKEHEGMGNLVYYVIMKMDAFLKMRMVAKYENKKQKKKTSIFSKLPVLKIKTKLGERSRAHMLTDIPVVTPDGFVEDGGYKAHTAVVIPAQDNYTRKLLGIPGEFITSPPSVGIYDSETKTFIKNTKEGDHLLIRVTSKEYCTTDNTDYMNDNYISETLGSLVAELAVWYEIAQIPGKYVFGDKVIYDILLTKESYDKLRWEDLK